MSGEGVSQRLTRRASAKAAKTLCGAAARRRRSSTRVSAACVVAPGRSQQLFELVDRPGPECPMTGDPPRRVVERLGAQPKAMKAPLDGPLDEPGALEHLQVFRNGGLGRAEPASEFAGAAGFAPREGMNHRTAGAVGEGAERAVKAGRGLHSHMAI